MLEVTGLTSGYGQVEAVSKVTLRVPQGKMVALVGRNGAGKSTLLNTLTGMIPARSGQVRFDGQAIDRRPPYQIAKLGLLQVPEGREILGALTVVENLELGRIARGVRPASAAANFERIFDLFPILAARRVQLAGSLSGGEQQMLAIARAIMGSPKMLLLDEPSLGLAPLATNSVFALLARLNGEGMTILLVEQNARRALELTDYTYVLEQGRIRAEGPSAGLRADSQIIAQYLGIDPGAKSDAPPKASSVAGRDRASS